MHRLPALALLSLHLAASAAESVAPADAARIMPPPGLYQLERDSTSRVPAGGLSSREQRDAGGSTLTETAPGSHNVRRDAGPGRETACVPARGGQAPGLPPTLPAAACRTVSSTASGDRLELVAQCRSGRVSTTVQRLDERRWDFITHSEIAASGGAPDINALRPMLERMAASGATAAERDKARQMLAKLPQLQATQQQQLAAAGVNGGAPAAQAAMLVDGRVRWTRIGDNCAAGRP